MPPTSDIYVWMWLPGQSEPVSTGRLRRFGAQLRFAYRRSYLELPDAISLYGPELPLREGWISPVDPAMSLPSCLRDGAPDSWGQQAIASKHARADPGDLPIETYLTESGTNRLGANDFQTDPDNYVPREDTASLDELHHAADMLAAGEELPPTLADSLIHGTSIGGARPKALISDRLQKRELIAKFSKSTDQGFPFVNAEAACTALADRCGIPVSPFQITSSLGRDVLILERFDRTAAGGRLHVVSALTILGLDEMQGRYATYPDLLDKLRRYGRQPDLDGDALFRRIVFNVAISNTDDHARNHACFWDGQHLSLTPAYDLAPQHRSGDTATLAMAIDRDDTKTATFGTCLRAAGIYGLSPPKARAIIDEMTQQIREGWDESADIARLNKASRNVLWGRQILNPAAWYDYGPR